MNAKELRELDAWTAENVMGYKRVMGNPILPGSFIVMPDGIVLFNKSPIQVFQPTIDPAAAMEVLKRCGEKCISIEIIHSSGKWTVLDGCEESGYSNLYETLELAICQFAKQLFDRPITTEGRMK